MNQPATTQSDQHDEIRMLLPWYANDTLAAAERERVQAHLSACDRCATALRHEQALREFIAAPQNSPEPSELGLARLRHRIGQETAAATATLPPRSRTWFRSRPAIAAAALLAISAPIAFNVYLGGSGKTFRTLASAPAATPASQGNDIRIVFKPTLGAEQRRAILEPFGGLVIDGPNSVGAYTVRLQAVEPDAAALRKAIELLRQQSSVQLAESIAP